MKPVRWPCKVCRHLLGKRDGARLHIKSATGDEYLCPLPVLAFCRVCDTPNELQADDQLTSQN